MQTCTTYLNFANPSHIMKSALAASIAATFTLLSIPAQAGTFTVLPLTGDIDSGISADKAYTHAIDMGDGPNRTVNGAVFTGSGGGANPATNNYSTTGITDLLPGWVNPNVSGATGGLFTNFNYQGAGGTETVTLNNLRVGQQYVTTFYNSLWGGPRSQNITTSDGGFITFDPDATPGSLLQYAFTATANTQTYTFVPNQPASFHQAAFTNELEGYKALLTDNFYAPSNPNTNDVNFNLAARQGGSLVAGGGPISYVPVGNTQVGNPTGGIDSGNYLLSAFGARTAIDHNFKGADSAGGLSISFDFAPNSVGNGDTTVWESVLLGMSAADKNIAVNDAPAHFGILFRGNGGIQAFDGNAVVSGAETWGAGATNALNHIELLVTDPTDSNPFDGIGETDIAVYSNGSLIYSYIKSGGGYADDFINFGSTFISGADNVMIAQIPEPGSLALLALGGLALLRRRRQGAS